jgi:gliding motility-associated-like protein
MRSRICAGLLAVAAISNGSTVEAQSSFLRWWPFVNPLRNGGFEDNGFAHWNRRYKTTSQTSWRFWRPGGHPQPEIIDASWDEFASVSGVSLPGFDLSPFCDGKMALINDLQGNKHMTKLSQRFRLGEQNFGAALQVEWGALLVDGGHTPTEQPSLSIRVLAGSSVLGQYQATASTGLAGGWAQVGTVSSDPVWFKQDTLQIPLLSQSPSAKLTVEMIVSDCTQGGHGGCAFIDCVQIVPCTNVVGAISLTVPNVFTPNGDGINDLWGPINVSNATLVEIDVYNRWGGRVFHATPLQASGFFGVSFLQWNGTLNGSQVPTGTYDYVVRARNCNAVELRAGTVTIFR